MPAAIQCPDDATLRLLLLGELADGDMQPLGSHLLACPECANRADTLDIADALTVSLGEVSTLGESADPLVEKLRPRLHHLGDLRSAADQTQSIAAPAEPSVVEQCDAVATSAGPSFAFLLPPQRPDELGRLGGYRILKVLGQGGMGVVFLAEDVRLARRSALKVMLPEIALKPGMKERFLREARAAAQIEHDRIIPIFQVDEDRGVPYIAMPLLQGISLEDWIHQPASGSASPTDIPTILSIVRQVAEGLSAAHDRGMIHRDVKPANIWLQSSHHAPLDEIDATAPSTNPSCQPPRRGRPHAKHEEYRIKILDFGLARLSEAAGDEQLTQSGAILGTPSYMAPEQARGEALDGRADLFSLGVILYRLCTGAVPFKGKDTLSTLLALATHDPPPPHSVNPAIPEPLSELVMKLLAKERDDRVRSARELIVAIDALQAPHEGAVKATTIASSRRKSWAIAAVLLAMLVPVWHFGPTVYRFVTNQGQLIIETDDPNFEITVRGDQVRIIDVKTGGQINLQAGKYQAELTRGEGLQLATSEFTLNRGGREVLRVRRAPTPAAAPDATPQPSAERDPFLVIAGDGMSETRHANLSEAVAVAASGDTIEIRGNGPFLTPPLKITQRLQVRSGAGFRPVIQLSQDAKMAKSLISANAPLVLEGLEFHWLDSTAYARDHWLQLISASSALYAANCRFVTRNVEVHIAGVGPHLTDARNCEFLSPQGFARSDKFAGYTNVTQTWPGRRIVLDNCLLTSRINLAISLADPKGASFRLTHNTWRSPHAVAFIIYAASGDVKEFAEADWRGKSVEVHASDNVFATDTVFLFSQAKMNTAASPGEAEALLARMAGWQGERNVYASDSVLLGLTRLLPTMSLPPPNLPAGLAGWKQLWGVAEQGSADGQVRLRGDDLLAKAETSLERITPDDFRLLPGSAGYRAGKDGKDLGADVDFVGPGAAYERWKRTPQYQEWLQETGQKR